MSFSLKVNLEKIAEQIGLHQQKQQQTFVKEYIRQSKNILGNHDEFLDKVENTYRGYAQTGKSFGWNKAAGYLEHFLDESQQSVIVDKKEAREKPFIKNAEKINRDRFIKSMSSKNGLGARLLKLKPGHEMDLQDNWDYEFNIFPTMKQIKNMDFLHSHILRGDMDEAFATGTSFLKSQGDFTAKRRSNTIYLEGIVTHRWNDYYDFNPKGGPLPLGAAVLEQNNRAENFEIQSEWKQKLTGSMNVKNGKLVNRDFNWDDIDESE